MSESMEHYLDKALTAYSETDIYPFHMPGHKRQRLGDFTPEEIDITEVEGFDNLHHAAGILREGQDRLARVFGAEESFYLVNGSTAGILAAVCGCMQKGGRLLIARNCHRSVYHAAYLAEAKLACLFPEQVGGDLPGLSDFEIQGSVAPQRVEEALKRFPDAQAVVITSPTYDGVVSDIRAIADLVHARGIPLIVDEAHGAHFGFSEDFPQKAIALGADLCVESLHKTLPAYTQSAALHMQLSGYFDASGVRRYLDLFQSTSPSYVLMAGIDRCVRMMEEERMLYQNAETRPDSRFGQFEERLRRFYEQSEKLQSVRVFPRITAGTLPGSDTGSAGVSGGSKLTGIYARDYSKILISAEAAGLHGQQLYDLLLEKYHLQMEMAAGSYVTALTGIMDTDEGFARLLHALEDIDRAAPATAASQTKQAEGSAADFGIQQAGGSAADSGTRISVGAAALSALYAPREKRMEIAQAMDAKTSALPISMAAGQISAEFVYLYPPGIPILVPGEVISDEVIDCLETCRGRGMQIRGMQDPGGSKILIVD